jgi:serine/threonine-protein kinase RIO1
MEEELLIDIQESNQIQSLLKTNKQIFSDKSDRATCENVLDPRTRLILFKLLNQNIISEVNGCVSTGKEGNF